MGKKIIKKVEYMIEDLLDIIYPDEEKCIACGEDGFIGLCPLCNNNIKRIAEQDDILSYGYYGNILKKLVLAFKYNKNFTAGKVLAEFLITLIEEKKIEFDVICYVPMTKKAIKARGFNQCEVISKKISRRLDKPLSRCIIKNKDTKEQKTLSKEDREKNIRNAFKIKDGQDIYNKKVLLIDDVVTTGATVMECKKMLEKSGVEKITVLTIAKSHI